MSLICLLVLAINESYYMPLVLAINKIVYQKQFSKFSLVSPFKIL